MKIKTAIAADFCSMLTAKLRITSVRAKHICIMRPTCLDLLYFKHIPMLLQMACWHVRSCCLYCHACSIEYRLSLMLQQHSPWVTSWWVHTPSSRTAVSHMRSSLWPSWVRLELGWRLALYRGPAPPRPSLWYSGHARCLCSTLRWSEQPALF